MATALLYALLPALADALHPAPWFAAPLRAAALLPPGDALDPQSGRCIGCGVVESIRALEPVAGAPAAYEFNVRLRDGTLRTSTTDGKAAWRVGDRIIVVGGSAH